MKEAIQTDPRKVGGVYRSGYWGKNYTVLAIDGIYITVRWEDGNETTHCTGWDSRRDSIISEPQVVTAAQHKAYPAGRWG